ncbi:hypothetical protein DEU56DRAFT_21164 [Suillus clintonianus]|uniref:uncharacterized protein n=1 Tax=Suillus clintonianus TaxID=1904413 RepID=UPI001B868B36|nr:uncharacterized protein DEU56DRAFT_21164 [Suillus clintonianus]KAG2157453.1 hypothetical protein DEU56DRAFT_21164 [Suillus clintonianus]
MSVSPPVFNIHTPTSSFALIHSLKADTIQQLYDKLSRKPNTGFHGKRVGPGWIKYNWNDAVWNMDDESDYTIFVWRQKTPSTSEQSTSDITPTLHVHDPTAQLPEPPAYCNPSFYLFDSARVTSPRPRSARSAKSHKSRAIHPNSPDAEEISGVAKHRKDFERFHSENGVRTVLGTIGPVDNVRMLLKNGYRHVYISRKFALRHGFIPADAAPGHYGYSGLVNLGKWPITLKTAADFTDNTQTNGASNTQSSNHLRASKSKTVSVPVFLSEEPHFDVVLGRSFFEKRQIKTSSIDPTEVICLDTGDKIECELVILKDGRGQIVTVT